MQLRRLKRRVQDINLGGRFHEDVMLGLMVSIRKVLEESNTTKLYPVLSLYCHWLQHSNMNKNNNGFKLLEKIDSAFLHSSHNNPEEHQKSFEHSFGSAELRRQMRAFFQSHGLSSAVTDSYSNWSYFLLFLCRELTNVELAFPPRVQASSIPGFNTAGFTKIEAEAYKVRQRIEKRAIEKGIYPDFVINSFCIAKMEPDDERR